MFSLVYEKGFEEQLKLAQNGNAESQYLVGLAYARGNWVAPSDFEANGWYQKAAAQGHADAIYMLEMMKLKSAVGAMKSQGSVEASSQRPIAESRTLTFMSSAQPCSAFRKLTPFSNFVPTTRSIISSSQAVLSTTNNNDDPKNIIFKNIHFSSIALQKRYILFDIDDTLIDFRGSIKKTDGLVVLQVYGKDFVRLSESLMHHTISRLSLVSLLLSQIAIV